MSEIPLPSGEFVPLPPCNARRVSILGPRPEAAATAVFPFHSVGSPIGPLHALVAGVCWPDPAAATVPELLDDLVEPLELWTVIDPQRLANQPIPAEAVWHSFCEFQAKRANFRLLGDRLLPLGRISGLTLYCRRRHQAFSARAIDGGHVSPLESSLGFRAAERTYSATVTTRTPAGVYPLEQLITDQGEFARRYADLFADDPLARKAAEDEHLCCTCPEQGRCYPSDGGYAFALDRLVPLSLTAGPVHIAPHGPWTLAEAAAIAGGAHACQLLDESANEPNAYQRWRRSLAGEIESVAPARLLVGETDGRELVEAARVKLTLIAGVLRQLHAVWHETGRPHLCWNADSIRVRWRSPGALPGAAWGFSPLLRFGGVQPAAQFETFERTPTPFPPHFSDPALLAPELADAVRNFDTPRPATVFVKRSKTTGDAAEASLLLESLHLPWESFCPSDTLHIRGDGWLAVVQPAAARDKNDGEGLPFSGRVTGKLATFKSGEQFDGCECHWYPRFGQAVDLHAVGMLLFETLLATDERAPAAYRSALLREREELIAACSSVPVGQRDAAAREWIAQRALIDAPAAAWSRRNLLFRADERARTVPDGFPAALWLAILTFGVRMMTALDGFSLCPNRAAAAPRLADGPLLPLVELEGLIALLDDELFGRSAPGKDIEAWVSSLHQNTPIAGNDDD
jgi:hypothetical protein